MFSLTKVQINVMPDPAGCLLGVYAFDFLNHNLLCVCVFVCKGCQCRLPYVNCASINSDILYNFADNIQNM